MTLKSLRFFLALAEERSFTAVAKKYYVAQTAVSYQIKTLEEELGVSLFERSTRTVNLTLAGRSLYLDLKPAMEQLDAALQAVHSRKRKTFTIGYSRICFGTKFKSMIDELTSLHPDVEFLLELAEPENDMFSRIRNGKIDVALYFDPFPEKQEDLEYLNLGRRSRMLLVSENHPLGNCSVVTEEEIDSHEVVVCEGMQKIEQVGNFLKGKGKTDAQNNIVLRDMESVLAMVRAGRGVACLPTIDDVGITGIRHILIRDDEHKNLGPILVLAWAKGADSPELRSARAAANKIFR